MGWVGYTLFSPVTQPDKSEVFLYTSRQWSFIPAPKLAKNEEYRIEQNLENKSYLSIWVKTFYSDGTVYKKLVFMKNSWKNYAKSMKKYIKS